MKKLLTLFATLLLIIGARAQDKMETGIVLVPFVDNSAATPKADKALLDKLNRIITRYGVSGKGTDQMSPFVLTAHAIEEGMETTATAPPHTVVTLSVTFYVGNGVDGQLFASKAITVKGVGDDKDKAYAAAFRKINVDDPDIAYVIYEGEQKITDYYNKRSSELIASAEAMASGGNYADAYSQLLQIPPVSPQYEAAQKLIAEYAARESDSTNEQLITSARAAWAAAPNEEGAAEARRILAGMTNISKEKAEKAEKLLTEIGNRLQAVDDREAKAQADREAQEIKAEARREARQHQLNMAQIRAATKVAVARAKRPVYRRWWW